MPDRLSLGDGTCPTGTAGAPYYCVPGNPGRDTIVGGSGSDTVTADRVDRIARDCEQGAPLEPAPDLWGRRGLHADLGA